MKKIVVLDAGHGGTDPGAVSVGYGLREATLTLQITQAIAAHLARYKGVEVLHTRITDKAVSLSERVRIANTSNADLFVSIHINAGGGTGYEDYTYKGTQGETERVRGCIHRRVAQVVSSKGLRNRGRKQADYYVLRETKMPAILTESLFIDTKEDAERLKDAGFVLEIAKAHAEGIAEAYGLKVRENEAVGEPERGEKMEVEVKYDTIEEVPQWARESVRKAIELKVLQGNGKGLNLTTDKVEQVVREMRIYTLLAEMIEKQAK